MTAGATAPGWLPPSGGVTRVVLVRHGSTVHSLARRFSGRNDLPLDDAGATQAAALGRRGFGGVTAVLSSPLRRAAQTAAAIAGPLGLAVETMDDLVETDFGTWEGLTFAEARASSPAEMTAWAASPEIAPPGGESFDAVAVRVRRARAHLLAEYAGATVVAVTHVTPIKTFVRLALDAPPSALFRLHLDTASVSVIDYAPDGTPSVRLVNDTSHLG